MKAMTKIGVAGGFVGAGIVGAGFLVVLTLSSCPNSMQMPLLKDISSRVGAADPSAGGKVAMPVISPSTGSYSNDQSVTITCATAGSTIHYTTDGSTPTGSTSTYSEPIPVAQNGTVETIKAIATKSGMTDSQMAQATITINYDRVSTPQFSPPGDTYHVDQTVTINCSTEGATIYYTTDGNSPTGDSSEYTGPISVAGDQDSETKTTTIRAIAIRDGIGDSTVAIATFSIAYPRLHSPQLSLPSGLYSGSPSLTIVRDPADPSDVTIVYTTNGTEPSRTHGTTYSNPLTIVNGETVKAVACKSEYWTSPVAAGTYTIVPSGSLDSSFGSGGMVRTDFVFVDDWGYAAAIQSDGKIVVAGSSDDGGNAKFALVRYTATGSLDSTFGSGGKVTTDFASDYDDCAYAVAIQSDGKIVVAGSSRNSSNSKFALARYTTTGSLDSTFGSSGKVTTGFVLDPRYDCAYAVAIQSDGKIVVAGVGDQKFAVARYSTTGSLDSTFGSGGKVTTQIGINTSVGRTVAIQGDGKIIVAGNANNSSNNSDFTLARFTANGSLDTSFGSGGKVMTDFASTIDSGRSVAIQSDGKILVAGDAGNGFYYDFALARYTTNGSLDSTFGSGGKVTTPNVDKTDHINAVVIQSDGKIVAAGYSETTTSVFDFAVARYAANGSLDSTFGSGGKVLTDFGSNTDYGESAAIQSDGKILVAGCSRGSNLDFAVVRYWP